MTATSSRLTFVFCCLALGACGDGDDPRSLPQARVLSVGIVDPLGLPLIESTDEGCPTTLTIRPTMTAGTIRAMVDGDVGVTQMVLRSAGLLKLGDSTSEPSIEQTLKVPVVLTGTSQIVRVPFRADPNQRVGSVSIDIPGFSFNCSIAVDRNTVPLDPVICVGTERFESGSCQPSEAGGPPDAEAGPSDMISTFVDDDVAQARPGPFVEEIVPFTVDLGLTDFQADAAVELTVRTSGPVEFFPGGSSSAVITIGSEGRIARQLHVNGEGAFSIQAQTIGGIDVREVSGAFVPHVYPSQVRFVEDSGTAVTVDLVLCSDLPTGHVNLGVPTGVSLLNAVDGEVAIEPATLAECRRAHRGSISVATSTDLPSFKLAVTNESGGRDVISVEVPGAVTHLSAAVSAAAVRIGTTGTDPVSVIYQASLQFVADQFVEGSNRTSRSVGMVPVSLSALNATLSPTLGQTDLNGETTIGLTVQEGQTTVAVFWEVGGFTGTTLVGLPAE